MGNDETWRIVTLCAMISEARAMADTMDTLLAAHLSLAETRAVELRDKACGRDIRSGYPSQC